MSDKLRSRRKGEANFKGTEIVTPFSSTLQLGTS